MTTIAYKDGIIAYDSQSTDGSGVVVDSKANKHIARNGVDFFLSGSPSDAELFLEAYFGDLKVSRELDLAFIIHKDGELFTASIKTIPSSDNHIIWTCRERLDNHIAYGSGERFALAYMDCGLSAEEAVLKTMERDVYTGGQVNVFRFASLSE